MTILDKIIARKKEEIAKAKSKISIEELKNSEFFGRPTFSLKETLKTKSGIVAEFKRKSPSKGIINDKVSPLEVVSAYEKLGASGISILTDLDFFGGNFQDILEVRNSINIPILRKDFIIEPYQIYESVILGADAILLIAAILDTATLNYFIKLATKLGLSCLVEVHELSELKKALKAGAQLIGVNNRDLKTFKVDLNTSLELAKKIPSHITMVSESGINKREQIISLQQAGFRAALIGETLMCSPNLAKTFSELMGTEYEN